MYRDISVSIRQSITLHDSRFNNGFNRASNRMRVDSTCITFVLTVDIPEDNEVVRIHGNRVIRHRRCSQ